MEIEDEDKFIKENHILFKKYEVKKKLGEGAFGDVYLGQQISSNEYVAIKTEYRKIIKPILESEAFLLYSIAGPGIPEVKSFGKTKKFNILVEPLLGKSLFDIFTENHKNMNIIDACLIGKQVIDRIQWIHSKYIVHRDIKPDNFLIGRKDPNVIYLIDFGLSKKYRSTTTGKHIRFGFTGKLTGTVRFASANALRGGEQSRRDDIESIGYMMVYFLKRRLPWQSITGNKKMERYLKIYKMKKNTTPEKLCEGLFPEMAEFISYAKSLEFEQEPDYTFLKNIFNRMLKRVHNTNEQLIFSWIKMKDLTNLKNPINPASRKDSPQSRIYKKIKSNLEKGRNLTSDSDSKNNVYSQINANIINPSNINIIDNNNKNILSEDQLESKGNKLDKSMKSKEGLNTTVANLEVTVDENVDFDNEKLLNKTTNILNRNLNSEFDKDINKNKIEDSDRIINDMNNINDNFNNNNLDIIIKKDKEKKELYNIKTNEIKNINEKKEMKNNIKDDKNDVIDFTFNESLNTNPNNSKINLTLKNNIIENENINNKNNDKNKKENNKNNNENIYILLTGKNIGLNQENNNIKTNKQIELNNKINVNSNNKNINNNNIKDKKLIKNNKKIDLKKNEITITPKTEKFFRKTNINSGRNINNNKTKEELNEKKYLKKENDKNNQISKEKNNNLNNKLDIEMNFNINNIKKRPSAGQVLNYVSLSKKGLIKNNNNNVSKKNNNPNKVLYKVSENNDINNKGKNRRIYQNKSNLNFPPNSLYLLKENNNNILELNKKEDLTRKEYKTKLTNKNIIYKGNNNKSFKIIKTDANKNENKEDKYFYQERSLIPEDNIQEREYNNRTINGKISNNNFTDINNNMYQSYYQYASKITPNKNKIKNPNKIKKSPNISQRNANVIKMNKDNKINKLILSMNNSVYNDSTDFQRKTATMKVSKNKNKNNINKIINNNNIPLDTQVNNNYSISSNKAFINNQLLTNSQINYQFPVYINNNNNIYNTQYLNTADNIPINQINKKFITLAPTQIQTNLNLGQEVQFINNYGNMRYTFEPNDNIY